MDDRRFDALTRSLAAGASRRRVLKGLFGGFLGAAAIGGGSRTYAQDEETPVPETDAAADPVVDETAPVEEVPPVEDTPPVAETAPAEEPPAEEPPAEPPVDPPVEPPAEPAVEAAVDEGTPADPAGQPPVACGEGWTPCESLCCEPGWRCCGVYCIPEGACCGDAECPTCEICSLEGICFPVCDELGLECCIDEKNGNFYCAECCRNDPSCEVVVDCEFCHENGWECCVDDKHQVTCGDCCEDNDCYEWGSCHRCYGGYCLSCFDQTDGHSPICAIDECVNEVAAGDISRGYCVQACFDEQCGPCERLHDGKCVYVCEYGEHCCEGLPDDDDDDFNGGYCAECCSREDCGECESCYEGHCRYECDPRQICCHGEYCAWENEGCCGGPGDWCEELSAADNLNGSCCGALHCCYDDKSKSGTCSECCDDYDCGPTPGVGGTGYCCGGVCQAECCEDKDCDWGVCVGGYCSECRENHDCGYGRICCEGSCEAWECCGYGDEGNCGDCETCIDYYCQATGVELYGACFPMIVAAADASSPQLNCCDGLVCCESKYGLVCLECCADHDCAHGCSCEDGFCSCGCASDKDCDKGTCCCKNGSCSADCCPKPPKPHDPPKKPHDPKKPPAGGTTVTKLPATGAGDKSEGSSWLGAAALGAAAAYLASRKLKSEATPETSTPEE